MGAIQFSGLASGMDTSSWIDALVNIKQQSVKTLQTKQATLKSSLSTLSSVQSKMSALRSSIEKVTDAKFGGSFDIFAKNTVTSSNTNVVSATGTADALRQNLDIVVNKMATSTKVTSSLGDFGLISEDDVFGDLSSGNAKEGSLSIFVDGVKTTIDVKKEDTLGSIIDRISAIDGVTAEIREGKVSITAGDGHNLVIGSASDKSNFASVMGLLRNNVTGNYDSASAVSKISTSSKIVDIFGEDALGTLKIGDAEFKITEDTTLKSFIGSINGSEDSGVKASWDASNGELVLKSKTEGAFNINIEAGTSNLTNLFGFTIGEKDEEGNYKKDEDGKYISKLKDQELGEYAELTINGTQLVSSSNTVTSDISGIEGLTLTLKSVSKPNEDGEIEPTSITVEQDTKALKDALKSFVTAFNDAITSIDDNTAYGKNLYGETTLTSIRNNLRRTATAATGGFDDDTLKMLSEIGISTGKANNSTSTAGVNKLEFDEEKFNEALAKNPEGVRKLLVGDNKGTATSGGVFNKLESIAEDALSATNGYFDKKTNSYNQSIKSYDTSISNAQLKVDSYKASLQKKFNAMEKMISSIRASYSQFV